MTTFNLQKGDRFNLTKAKPALQRVRLGLAWTANAFAQNADFDLDLSIFACGSNGKIVTDGHFVYYNQTISGDKAIVHQGDNRKGSGDGETVTIELAKLDPRVDELSFIVTMYNGAKQGQNFGQIQQATIRLYDDLTNDVIAEYAINEKFGDATALQMGSLVRENNQWVFDAVGTGFKRDLGDFVNEYAG